MRTLHSADKNRNTRRRHRVCEHYGRRFLSLLLCLCMVIPMMFGFRSMISMDAQAAGSSGATSGVTRQADPSTMDTYKEMLSFSENTRYAGRLWSDKTVFALGDAENSKDGNWNGTTLTLTADDDGVNGSITLDEDFLHVYSVLGSSQNVNTENARPLDVVLLLDISTSMTDGTETDAMHEVINDANELIDKLMKVDNDPSIHDNNRVGVVVYGGGAQVLFPLAHYEKDGNTAFLSVNNEYQPHSEYDDQSSHYFPRITATAKNFSKRSEYMLADSTYLQAALYQGMYMLATATNTTITENGRQVSRQPILITLTDGATNIVGATRTGTMFQADRQSITPNPTNIQFWDPLSWAQGKTYTENQPSQTVTCTDKHISAIVPRIKNSHNNNEAYGVPNGNPIYIADTNSASLTSVAPRTTAVLLTAGYMKNWIEDHYTTENGGNEVSLTGFGIGLNITPAGNNTYAEGGLQWAQLYGTMNPRQYIIDRADTSGGTGELQKVYQTLNEYIATSSSVTRNFSGMTWVRTALSATWTFSHPSGDSDSSSQGNRKYDVTSLEDVYYIDRFYNATTGTIGDIFRQITEQITTTIFAPVSGENDLGVGNAVTYMDPVGKYMDVKNVKNLVLFGTMYNVVKTAVYDYGWNDEYMTEHDRKGSPFQAGWYLNGSDGAKNATYGGKDDRPNQGNYTKVEDAWDNGWVYRLDADTAAQFVPTLKDINNVGQASAKQKATEYTFYRIDLPDTDRKILHMNPAYGSDADIPGNVTYTNDQQHLNTLGVYALADLRIWVEDTGDYSDPSTGGAMTDTNFDEALWVNIPGNMLPLRTITINGDAAGNFTYETNFAFPLRVFYTVGMSDEVLENGRVNVAGAISAEYIKKNKVTTAAAAAARGIAQGNIEFFSNWYNPLNRYSNYATTNTDYTYGDPVTSFSPSTDNRYYAFEKALPLYNMAYIWVPNEPNSNKDVIYTAEQGNWKKVVIDEDADEDSDAQTFNAADFGGRMIAQDLNPTNTQGTVAERQKAIWDALAEKQITTVHDGDIILLENHRLDEVDKPEEPDAHDPFSSNDYFYLAIEYYELKGDKTAAKMQYVITRKGSEFGSAYEASGITNGDMLCWHDVSGKNLQNYPYLSYSETGDRTRGKAYIGKTDIYEDDGTGKMVLKDPRECAQADGFDSTGTWVVCAKPGGLRVGTLAQAIREKGGAYSSAAEQATIEDYYKNERYADDLTASGMSWGFYGDNVTRTANNYFLPTISTTSEASENDIIVNVYLGNNGRLTVMDTTLLVTKLIDPPEGVDIDANEEFNFQLYIRGVTGKQTAVVVRYRNGSWQRQYHYIDLELDGKLFLQTEDGNKAMVDSEGCRLILNPGTDSGVTSTYVYAENCKAGSVEHKAGDPCGDNNVYYVYIGRNRASASEIGSSTTGFRVYHNDAVDGNGTVNTGDVTTSGASGEKGTFYAAKVWLVPVDTFDSAWTDVDPVNTTDFDIENNKDLFEKALENFELLTIDPDISTETSDMSFSTPYRTSSSYWTKDVYFGYKDYTDESNTPLTGNDLYDQIIPKSDRPDYFPSALTLEDIANNTAGFTLKHGEALLFSGIGSNSVYRVTEKLTDDQIGAGYALKEITHTQQVGSSSTYRPGEQSLPVYYDLTGQKSTFGEYGGKDDNGEYVYPEKYANNVTENDLMWALDQSGDAQDDAYVHYEPFFHTNAMVWEAYSTMDASANGDNHHQPAGFLNAGRNGTSAFWVRTGENSGLTHTVLDNPSCKSLEAGGCDEVIDRDTVRHYFFKDGEMRDFHYQGEGSGYIRNIGRFITSPTVHFGVKDETQEMAGLPAENTKSDTNYTGVYSVFGNTGTFEESANFVNTVDPDLLVITKQIVDEEGHIVANPPEREFMFEITLTKPAEGESGDTPIKSENLYVWKGRNDFVSNGVTWTDKTTGKTYKMPATAPKLSEYRTYILPTDPSGEEYLAPINLYKNETGTYTVTLKANEAIVIYGLEAGTKYTVKETKSNKYPAVDQTDHKVVSDGALTMTGTIVHNIETYLTMAPGDAENNNRADFYNQIFNGTLTVQKKIYETENVGDDLNTKEFDFTVTLTPAAAIPAEDALDGKDLVVMKYGADDAAGTKLTDVWSKVTDEGGDPTGAIYATFKLKHGERIVITGIPRNTGYTVAETRRDGYNLEHVTTDPHDENSESIQPTTDREGTVSGTITAEDKEIYLLYVNAKAPELPFTGSARGDMGMRIIMGAGIFLMAASSAVIFILRKKRGSYVK